MGTIVNSWNEWDPLERVIVGRPDGGMIPAPEPAAIMGLIYASDMPPDHWGPLPDDLEARAKEQMDTFVSILEDRGVSVDRPAPINLNQVVQTPDWKQDSMVSCMPARDLLLPIGNEIIEASMSQRSRWFEYLCYRPILEQYFQDDPNFIWTAAPKPRLTDETYVDGYWEEVSSLLRTSKETLRERTRKHQFRNTEKEPLWDAADIARAGKDLFVQQSVMTNKSAIDWLRRHLEAKGFRIHEVTFDIEIPWHIDTTICFPRPGLMFQNARWMPVEPEFHELLRINDWEVVNWAPPAREEKHPWAFTSIYLAYNVFSIDPQTICVESAEVQVMEQLDQYGFNVIPVDFYDVDPFGGGLHCGTADVFRQGDCEDYFPKQIPGF